MEKELYSYLSCLEIENAIRYIELYEKATSKTNNPIEYRNELIGRLKFVDKAIQYLCSKGGLTPVSIYDIYKGKPKEEDSRNYIISHTSDLYKTSLLTKPVSISDTNVNSAYRDLYSNLVKDYNETYFDGDKLKPMLKDDIYVAQQYFSQYQYLRRLKTRSHSRGKLNTVVNWLTGNIYDIDYDIDSYNEKVRVLNEAIEKNRTDKTPLPADFKEQTERLENEKKEIVEKCNIIVEKLDVNRLIEGDNPSFFQELDEGLKKYQNDLKDYRDICNQLNKIQKELDKLALEYDTATPERQVEIITEMDRKFQSGKAIFNNAVEKRKNIKEYSDILFSNVTLASVKSSKDVVADFISVFNIKEEDIKKIDLSTITDESLKKFISKYNELGLAEEKINQFLKNKKRLMNPNDIFGKDVYSDGKFDLNKFVDAHTVRKPPRPTSKGETKNPISDGKLNPEYPLDLDPFEELNKVEKLDEHNFLEMKILIDKIYGNDNDRSIMPKESRDRKYHASKVHIFGVLGAWKDVTRHKRQGNLYVAQDVFKALGMTLITILPINPLWNLGKKLWGKTQKSKFKKFYSQVQENIKNLTDEEAKFAMEHYRELLDGGLRTTEVLRQALKERIYAYVQKRTIEYNEELYNLILLVSSFAKSARSMREKASDTSLPIEEREEALKLSNQLYEKAGMYLTNYVNTYDEGSKFVHGDGYESFTHLVDASGTGMNITGGKFARNKKIDLNQLHTIAELSRYKDPSLSPEERVEKFMGYTEKSVEYTEYRRNALNLFSKSSVGLMEANPFITFTNYEKDPLISGLLSNIFMIISIANIVTSVINMIRHNLMVAAQTQANLANQNNVNNLVNQANTKIDFGNDAIDYVNDIGSYGRKNVPSWIEANLGSALGDVSDAKNIDELLNALNNHGKLVSNDRDIHNWFASMSDGMKNTASDLLSKYQAGRIGYKDLAAGLRKLSSDGTSVLSGEMNNIISAVGRQTAKGYNYGAFLNAMQAVQNGVSLGTFNVDLMEKVLSLPAMTSMSACQSLTLITPAMSTQSALGAVLGAGALGTGLLARKGNNKYNKTETILRDINSKESKELQDSITEKVNEMIASGKSDEEISRELMSMIEEGKKEVPNKSI